MEGGRGELFGAAEPAGVGQLVFVAADPAAGRAGLAGAPFGVGAVSGTAEVGALSAGWRVWVVEVFGASGGL